MTKGEALTYAIAFALMRSRKIIRGLKEGLTEEERYAVAEGARRSVASKRRGDANDRAAVNMKKLGFRRLDGRHPPTPPPLPSLKPRSPRPGLFIAAG